MAIGTVKWFNNSKGYGFICPTEGGEDIFVHFSSIEMEGYKSLKAGQEVFYEVNKGPKGLHAALIKPNEADATPQARTETRVKRESVERETAEA
jgi:CspA family cold shock protein